MAVDFLMQDKELMDVDWVPESTCFPCSPYTEPARFVDWVRDQPINPVLRQMLVDFRQHGNEQGVLHLTGLPVDPELPATPVNGSASRKQTFISEYVMARVASVLGEQVGYRQEKGGALFHQVTPSRSEEIQQSSEGSRVPLELHTERCFHPYLPDFLLLYCLRADPGGEGATTHVGIRELLPLMSDDLRERLFQPRYRTGIDYSFGNLQTEKANGPVLPILHGEENDPSIRYDLDLMLGLTEEAQQALDEFTDLLQAHLHEVILQPGEMLILDNHKTVHGRNTFQPGYRGQDRWLQRIYVVRDLAPSFPDRPDNGRVINTVFQ